MRYVLLHYWCRNQTFHVAYGLLTLTRILKKLVLFQFGTLWSFKKTLWDLQLKCFSVGKHKNKLLLESVVIHLVEYYCHIQNTRYILYNKANGQYQLILQVHKKRNVIRTPKYVICIKLLSYSVPPVALCVKEIISLVIPSK